MKYASHERAPDSQENLRSISNFFDNCGGRWISVYEQKGAERWYEYYPLRIRERYALSLIDNEPRDTAADLGCGTGHALLEMKRMGFSRIVGVDISDNMLQSAREMIARNGAEGSIELYKSDVQSLQIIESGSADVCTALGVIEYLPTDEPLLREVHRILKPNGVLVIQVKNRICYKNIAANFACLLIPALRARIWSRQHTPRAFLETLARNGFTVEEFRFAHYYALFPFSYVPGLRVIVGWLDNWLNKGLERLCRRSTSRFLASMFIAKARKASY